MSKLIKKTGGKSDHMMAYKPNVGIITLSDSVMSGDSKDQSGPILFEGFLNAGCSVEHQKTLPDGSKELVEIIDSWVNDGVELIITSGGTGLGPRDLTPEATKNVLDKEIPGITEAMRLETLKKTNLSRLSRGISGLRKKCLIINLPGSPKAVSECLEIIEPVLEHALTIISGKTSHK